MAAYALKQGWQPERFKAFVTQCLLIVSVYKALGLFIGGNLTRDAVLCAIWVVPFSILGIALGVITSRYIAAERFQRIVAVVLISVACLLIFQGAPAEKSPTAASAQELFRRESLGDYSVR